MKQAPSKSQVVAMMVRTAIQDGKSDEEIARIIERSENQVVTQNILSNQYCLIDPRNKGSCCDPSTERYHSM